MKNWSRRGVCRPSPARRVVRWRRGRKVLQLAGHASVGGQPRDAPSARRLGWSSGRAHRPGKTGLAGVAARSRILLPVDETRVSPSSGRWSRFIRQLYHFASAQTGRLPRDSGHKTVSQ
ncbi:unnamed protein product [Protopolystoma xenopodis]|uniref:Uncharacterized protein n=1 Tax=Protopolystoma xenopodis TaxID=117903 RepID=A0A3S5C5B1_9PLAT|nr:unnamed protein product [Protopolystoma xenopodis]